MASFNHFNSFGNPQEGAAPRLTFPVAQEQSAALYSADEAAFNADVTPPSLAQPPQQRHPQAPRQQGHQRVLKPPPHPLFTGNPVVVNTAAAPVGVPFDTTGGSVLEYVPPASQAQARSQEKLASSAKEEADAELVALLGAVNLKQKRGSTKSRHRSGRRTRRHRHRHRSGHRHRHKRQQSQHRQDTAKHPVQGGATRGSL